MRLGERKWLDRVRSLAATIKGLPNIAMLQLRRLLAERDAEKESPYSSFPCNIRERIDLQRKKIQDRKDLIDALKDYASIMERLIESRERMPQHKTDTELIDYILTGERINPHGDK